MNPSKTWSSRIGYTWSSHPKFWKLFQKSFKIQTCSAAETLKKHIDCHALARRLRLLIKRSLMTTRNFGMASMSLIWIRICVGRMLSLGFAFLLTFSYSACWLLASNDFASFASAPRSIALSSTAVRILRTSRSKLRQQWSSPPNTTIKSNHETKPPNHTSREWETANGDMHRLSFLSACLLSVSLRKGQ